MRLVEVSLENFRCYRTPQAIPFETFTAIIGRNDAGKSTILDALDAFFNATIQQDDGCVEGDRTSVRITCTFEELPDALVLDAECETTLQQEYLVDADGRLVIRKTYNTDLGKPALKAVEAYALHPSKEDYVDLLRLKRTDLLKRADKLGVDLDNVNKAANPPVRGAIRSAAAELGLQMQWVPLLGTEGGKAIWSALEAYLPAYALFKSDRASSDQDTEAQDPLRAAIREALKQAEPQLQKIVEGVQSQVEKIAMATVEKVREMDPALANTLQPVISTKKWDSLFNTSITGDGGIPLNKRGSGVRRIILLNFFRAAAEDAARDQDHKRSIIYAIEEPETSQHPRNQRLLLSALRDLAGSPNRQVVLTTHTPMLARAIPDHALRFVEVTDQGRSISVGGEQVNGRIAASLGVLPDHSVKLFIALEGKHDITFLKLASKMLLAAGEDVPDLDAAELSGEVLFVPGGGQTLAQWTNRLRAFTRPEIFIWDRDTSPPAAPKYQAAMDEVNQRVGCTALCTTKREMENYIHCDAIRDAYAQDGINLNLATFGDYDDVPLIVAQAVHSAQSPNPWPAADVEKCKRKVSRAKARLNDGAMRFMTEARLKQTDPAGEILSWLKIMKATLDAT